MPLPMLRVLRLGGVVEAVVDKADDLELSSRRSTAFLSLSESVSMYKADARARAEKDVHDDALVPPPRACGRLRSGPADGVVRAVAPCARGVFLAAVVRKRPVGDIARLHGLDAVDLRSAAAWRP